MKTKAKLVLALSVLTAGTAVAGATGTFAWFTTNRSATLTYSKVTAQSSNAKLEVTMGSFTENGAGTVTNKKQDGSFEPAISFAASNSYTTDVSSIDGKKFFKPDWKGQAGNNNEAYSVKDVTESKKDFTQFYFTVTNNGNAETHVFLDAGTKVSASTTAGDNASKDAALAKWTRVAVLDAKKKTAPVVGDVAGADLKVLFENTDGSSTKNLGIASNTLTESNTPTLSTIGDEKHVIGDFAAVISGTTETTHKGYLGKLTAGDTQAFVVSVWLEGTESNNQDAAAGGSVDVTLKLTGIEQVKAGA